MRVEGEEPQAGDDTESDSDSVATASVDGRHYGRWRDDPSLPVR
jgi:hypothetical protein